MVPRHQACRKISVQMVATGLANLSPWIRVTFRSTRLFIILSSTPINHVPAQTFQSMPETVNGFGEG